MKDYFDQSQPDKPGYTRIPGFMDVADYNDDLFIEHIKNDRFFQFVLNDCGHPNNATYRQAQFNTEFFENSAMAIAWNVFVESKRPA